MRSEGSWGMAMVLSSALQCVTTMAADLAALAQIIAMDMLAPHHTLEIPPLPQRDDPISDDSVPGFGPGGWGLGVLGVGLWVVMVLDQGFGCRISLFSSDT